MEKKSRLRGPNFTSSDSLLLCDILLKYKNVIENKKTDGSTLLQKQKAWRDVMEEYNAVTTGHHRTVESLQQNYKNLKKKTKKSASDAKMDIPVDREAFVKNLEEYGTSSEGWEIVAECAGTSKENCKDLLNKLGKEAETKEKIYKKNIMGTGGGPPPKHDDPLLNKVKGLVGSSIDGLYTIYDGDSSLMATQNICPIEINNGIIDSETLCTTICVDTDEKQSIGNTPNTLLTQDDQSSYFSNNRMNLKKKPHNLLSRKRKIEEEIPEKQSVSEKFKVLAAKKMESVNIQQELLKIQLVEEQEKLEHNRLLRAMELEDAKAKYAHNKKLRELEIKNLTM